MRYYISTGFLSTREVPDIARAADALGYDGLGIPDHVVDLAELETPYPYSRSGKRRWEPFADWPDPWVLIGSLAQVTTRLKFVTTVYIPAMRDPYSAAKSIGTAALLSNGRVELGIGVGWCREEFELLGRPFDHRGKRTEEMVDLMRRLWEPGWTDFDGDYFHTPKLAMSPAAPPIPVLVGGLTEIALARAARYDGWIGDLTSTDKAIATATRIRHHRTEIGRTIDDFTVMAPLTDALTPDDYARAEAGGITHILTMPWMFYTGPEATTAQKIADMERFRRDLKLDGDPA